MARCNITGWRASAGLRHVFAAETLSRIEIDLHRAALPLAPQRILQRVLDLRAVESPLARGDHEVHAGTPQRLDHGMLGLVP
jgi:hypothetical protein